MNRATMFFNVLTIFAIVAGPIIALQLQRRLDAQREAKQRKLWIFRTLMSFRATTVNPAYVQALNLIELDFNGSNAKEKNVRTCWKVLLDHLSNPATEQNFNKSLDLRAQLLIAMAKSLGYDFDEVQIKKSIYHPVAHVDTEKEQNALRKLLLEVLNGNRRIPVGVFQDTFPDLNIEKPDS
jgi:hypothetical protein